MAKDFGQIVEAREMICGDYINEILAVHSVANGCSKCKDPLTEYGRLKTFYERYDRDLVIATPEDEERIKEIDILVCEANGILEQPEVCMERLGVVMGKLEEACRKHKIET